MTSEVTHVGASDSVHTPTVSATSRCPSRDKSDNSTVWTCDSGPVPGEGEVCGVYTMCGGEQGHMRDAPSHPVNSQGITSGSQVCTWGHGPAGEGGTSLSGHVEAILQRCQETLDLWSGLGWKESQGQKWCHGEGSFIRGQQ